MKNLAIPFCLALMATSISYAEKPEWAGKGKPTAEQIAEHKASMKAKFEGAEGEFKREKKDKKAMADKAMKDHKHKADKSLDDAKAKADKKMDDAKREAKAMEEKGKGKLKAMEAQAEKKAGQAQKELDKGADKGKEVRQEAKKWWQFWDAE